MDNFDDNIGYTNNMLPLDEIMLCYKKIIRWDHECMAEHIGI
jgi:hypothetical protein